MKNSAAENTQSLTSVPLSPLAATLKLAALYGGLGIAWILLSDQFLSSIVEDPAKLTRYQTLKGIVYVLVTAAIFCLVLHHELVKRQIAQRRLLESDEKFRRLTDNINSVLWITNPEKNRMIYVSPGYERVWGQSCQTLYDSATSWLEAIVPDDRQRIAEAIITKQDSGLYDEEYRIARPDGQIRWVRDRAFPARNEAGEIYWIVGVADDITEMKRAQESLETASRMKSEFLNVMSHELRTPLNIIAGYVELLREGVLGVIEAKQVEALDKIARQSRELLTMINGILDVTKIEGGTVSVERNDVDLSRFFDEIRSDYALPFGKDVGIVWQCPEPLPVIHSDGSKLRSIVQNLLNNAVKFTETGTITVGCRPSPERGEVDFVVEDTGIGIPQEKLPYIFDLFWQADSSERRLHGGVGLGLYIVKKFTDLLGGRVAVQSEPGKGTVITVSIPDGIANERRIPA
jgi:PAS domain S-box-containing protein